MNLDPDELYKYLANNTVLENYVNLTQFERFEAAKKEFLEKFREHPVTREIVQGAEADNISGTLNGRGNLFTFIGFPAGSSPIEQVEHILEEGIQLIKYRKRLVSRGIEFGYNLLLPETELRKNTPLPFEIGNSWVYGIEEGISGFSNYIFTRLATQSSRSQHGIQNVRANLGGEFTPVPYVGHLFNELRDKLLLA